jgi:hypothetical protein
MTRYLISFDDGAMTFPEEELPEVAEAAHEVMRQAQDAAVWVFGGGLQRQQASVVSTRRDRQRRPLPGDQGGTRRVLDH